jgi:hypothetical protein
LTLFPKQIRDVTERPDKPGWRSSLGLQQLEHRRLLTSWMVELPKGLTYSAVAQVSQAADVCLAYTTPELVGKATVQEVSPGAFRTQRNDFAGPAEVAPPLAVHDAVFGEDGFVFAGSSFSEHSLAGGPGEPSRWIDGQVMFAGLEQTEAGNVGAFFAVDPLGRMVGEDDLSPIVFESGETRRLPLPEGNAVGGAHDISGNRIVGYANENAVFWESVGGEWSPRILDHQDGDTFGSANSLSPYGVIGGSYERESEGVSRSIGILWSPDGSILREFNLTSASEVTHVVDYLAAIATDDGTMIYDPFADAVSDLRQFLVDNGGLDVADSPLRLIDLELSADDQQLLFLLEAVDGTEPRQYVASVETGPLTGGRQHPWNRYDVNSDGQVTVLDALVVINRLGLESGMPQLFHQSRQAPFYDVSGDEQVTVRDALHVINQLGRLAAV